MAALASTLTRRRLILGKIFMSVLFYGIIAFSLAFFIHFIIWKIHLPKRNQSIALLKVFFGVLFISTLIFIKASDTVFLGIRPPQTFMEYIEFLLLYSSLTLAYIATYSAVEVDSPSLVIVLSIAKMVPEGLDREKLFSLMNDDLLLIPRINELVSDKMVAIDKDIYKLTPKGSFFVNTIILFRRLLNLPKGG